MVEEYIDFKKDKKTENRIYNLIDKMKKKIGIKIPKKNYPKILVIPKKHETNPPFYSFEKNIIFLNETDLYSGDAIGEEAGHFIRNYIIGGKGEIHTGEYFGALGRKILEKISTNKDKLSFLVNQKLGSKKDIVRELRKNRQGIRDWKEIEKTGNFPQGITPEKAKENREELEKHREGNLKHYRPYEFALTTNLNELNLKELYSLPDKEVRKRFFRKDKKYRLEKLVSIITISSLTLSILFLSPTLTGNSIANLTTKTSSIIGAGLFIVGIVGSYFWFKKR